MFNMCDIEILSNLEYNKYYAYSFEQYGNTNKPILAFYDSDLNLIKIGNIRTAKIAIDTLKHEYIHKTLKELFDKDISHKLDVLVYSNSAKSHKYGII